MVQMGDSNLTGDGGRRVYRHADLRRAFNPDSVAVVGLSSRPKSLGERTFRNLAHYDGKVFLVNPKYDEIAGERCYPSLRSLPIVPDCIVVASGAETVLPAFEEASELGVGGMVAYASGFAETRRPDRVALQARLAELARASPTRLIGPNCLGFYNLRRKLPLVFSTTEELPAPSEQAIGLASQSGALGQSLLQAHNMGFSFSHILTVGNSSDVDVADLIAFLAEEPGCKVIASLFEGVSSIDRLAEAAALARSRDKPIVMLKLGRSPEGAAAAMSHTGSLSGADAVYQAFFKREGIITVDDFSQLLETASFFAKAGRPQSAGVAVISTSGGGAINAADNAYKHDVPLPQATGETQKILEASIPDFGSARNPCDVTAQVVGDPDSLAKCATAMLGDPTFGTLLHPHTSVRDDTEWRLKLLSRLGREHGKPVCIVLMSGWISGPGVVNARLDPNLCVFYSMTSCFAALGNWVKFYGRDVDDGESGQRASPADAAARATAIFAKVAGNVVTEGAAKEILSAYGIPTVREVLTQTADEAKSAARDMGFPVALKIESADFPHKTEAGVIALNLQTEAQVAEAFDRIAAAAKKAVAEPRIAGTLVQTMVGQGVEVLIGGRIDPLFGPVIVAGFGGIFVEVLNDTAIALAPVNHAAARAMIDSLKGQALLNGFRGMPAVDVERLADLVCRVSELLSDHSGIIREIDVNPVICSGDALTAVDALIRIEATR